MIYGFESHSSVHTAEILCQISHIVRLLMIFGPKISISAIVENISQCILGVNGWIDRSVLLGLCCQKMVWQTWLVFLSTGPLLCFVQNTLLGGVFKATAHVATSLCVIGP